jgi:AraC-like DNA-binding protein
MKIEHINPHVRFAMSFKYPIKSTPLVAYDAHIYYITSGSGAISSTDFSAQFRRGCVILVPAGIPYLFSSDEDVFCICLNFDFTKSNSHTQESIHPAQVSEFNPERISDPVRFEDNDVFDSITVFESSELLLGAFERIEAEFISKKQLYRESVSAMLKWVLTELLRAKLLGSSAISKVDKILGYVKEHFSENITNKRLSEVFGYHPYHLNRLMKAALGTTLHQYLIFYRIEMAKRFLTDSNYTVFEICHACGYNNFSNFSSDFKKRVGCSPRTYRELGNRR